MKIEFDSAKNERNIQERGISFLDAELFDFDTAILVEDLRKDYGEKRLVAYGYIANRLHVLCFKPLDVDTLNALCIRVISLRKANKREEKFYAKNID